MTLHFTGKSIVAFGRMIPASSIVRVRESHEVLREKDGRISKYGTPYKPQQFPPGNWEITAVAEKPESSLYWPDFILTNAWQWLDYWSVDEQGHYLGPTGERFKGYGYGAHHARFPSGGKLIPSRTTLGCMNTSANDARWLASEIRIVMSLKRRVFIHVPRWEDWEA